MSEHDHDHHHSAPASPYHHSERSAEDNKVLAERVAKIESLLIAKGLVDKRALDKLVDIYENDLGPMNGAKVVARAWVDPDYKRRLLDNATAAIAELGFGGLQGEHMVVVENTPQVHNIVVCTLCSCYPWPVLGLPPTWYKDAAYRSRVVIDPRSVLSEFGTTLEDDVEVRVWDSSAEIRYLVLPERPAGTEKLNEAQLVELIDRDSMIGVKKVRLA
jgi:nitrile hydratase